MAMPKGKLEEKLKEEHELIGKGVLREENPLDLSDDFAKFLEACRRGDLMQCQTYITAGININGKDEFDYTPLIIASLCGHYEVAELLLESGALAERNTFQGERCLYNALNSRIRNLLLRYDYSKSSDPLQPWSSHITSLLTTQEPTSDIVLKASAGPGMPEEEFRLHKFLLSARTPYFQRKLALAPELPSWNLPSHVPAQAFRIVLHYLYLDDIAANASALDDAEEVLICIDKITKQLGVEQLWDAILEGTDDRRIARQRYQDEVGRAQEQVTRFFQERVVGNKIVVDTSKVDNVKWTYDNSIFADCLLCAEADPDDEHDNGNIDSDSLEKENKSKNKTNGIPIGPAYTETSLESHRQGEETTAASSNQPSQPRTKSVLYPAHKAMLVRAEYFKVMFASGFIESQRGEHLRIIKVSCRPEVLEIVMSFLYTEEADIPLEIALDVVYMADMMFMAKLKNKAAVIISTLGSGNRNALSDPTRPEDDGKKSGEGAVKTDNAASIPEIDIYEVLRAAWDLKIQRLEDFAARYLAYRLEDYIHEEVFADLVMESAGRLKTRQETDSIELLDDIRHFLSERFRMRFEEIALSDIVDEDYEAGASAGSAVVDEDGVAAGSTGRAEDTAVVEGVMRTLDGEVVEDEFDADSLNYKILLSKIDTLLDRLGLSG
ncbi:btb poz domain-containing protein [Ophiostoma piceae UAMH 11346]|uniref:Btb poz domain-containing protein n=1 Tax=Ophiostoma piceae (strain UAMH 11346) TaxID=1262450 RepID=S3BVL8_OPHP1|nr:btb poz domain-containing protein [Ophiostoma piceae UAMH 11346]